MQPSSNRSYGLNFFGTSNKHLLIAIATSILAAQGRSLATTGSANSTEPSFFVSTETAIFFFIGIVISFFYIKGMAGVLRDAVRTYSSEEEDTRDTFTKGFVGAILAAIASAVVIWSYGLGAYFLYVGPVLSLLSPIGIIYFMALDIQRYKETSSPK
ncbi:hypothetical protein [Nodosilinea sp. FACHB-13]|uniref:hypothetical protein n=1 Tax=Cyanophyceae TaxID=3028117 RepID=UPI0016871FD8|nr:hypothetical protein [Nodosilinea sp. FACHB-13]MBD2109806.1 hypothetical protein [Nodosilinea sp. FACHB-13]